MPALDFSFYNNGGGGGGGGNDQSPFGMISDVMKLREQVDQMSYRKQLEEQARQQAEETRLRNQKLQSSLNDDDAVDLELQKWSNLNPGAPPDIDTIASNLSRQGKGGAAMALTARAINWTKDRAAAMQETAKAQASRVGLVSQMLQGVQSAPEERRPEMYASAMKQAVKLVPEAAQYLPPQYDAVAVDQAIDQGLSNSEYLTKQRDAIEGASKLIGMNGSRQKLYGDWTVAGSNLLSLSHSQQDWEANMGALKGGMVGLPAEFKDSILKQFGDTYSSGAVEQARKLGMTQAQRSEEKSRNNNFNLEYRKWEDQLKGDIPLTDKAIEMIGTAVAKGAPMSNYPFGLGSQAVKDRTKVYNFAADAYMNLDLASANAAFKANSQNLVKQENLLSNVKAFEGTALKNLDLFLDAASKVVDTGSPLLNSPLRKITGKVLGSGDQAAFTAANQVVTPEFARLLQAYGASSGGTLSDTAREEVKAVLDGSYTMKQLYDVANILRQDAFNRKDSLVEEIGEIKRRLAQGPPRSTPASVTTVPGGGAALNGGGGGGLPPNLVDKIVTQGGVKFKISTDATGNVIKHEIVR